VPVTPVLTKRWSAQRSWTMQTYESLEGYRGLRKALAVAPAQLVELIKAANLRGR
jgi:NADH-quinone oxidoreductase subunit F